MLQNSGREKRKAFISPTDPSSSCHIGLRGTQGPERECGQQWVQKSPPTHAPELLPPSLHEPGLILYRSVPAMFLAGQCLLV